MILKDFYDKFRELDGIYLLRLTRDYLEVVLIKDSKFYNFQFVSATTNEISDYSKKAGGELINPDDSICELVDYYNNELVFNEDLAIVIK